MPILRKATGRMKNVTVNIGTGIHGTHIGRPVEQQIVHRMTT